MSTDIIIESEYKDHGHKRYSEDAKVAVRYAYQYRAAVINTTTQFVCFLPELPGVFCWLAEKILEKIALDAFQRLAEKTYKYLKQHRRKIDSTTKRILTDPEEVRRFYNYIKDYKDRNPNISQKEMRGIIEGIMADYTKTEAEKIYNSMGRFPTDAEYQQILKNSRDFAKMLLSDWFSCDNKGVVERV